MKKRKSRKIKFGVVFLLVLLLSLPISVYATEIGDAYTNDDLTNEVDKGNENRFSEKSPWMDNADDSIYSDSIEAGEESPQIEPKKPGMVEKYLSELIRNASSSLISLLDDKVGASIDKIIYGRVGSGKPNSANIFAFELRSGNPYGVTGSICYALLRSMAFVMLGISFVFLLSKSAWTGRTGQSRDQIKSNFYGTAMKFTFLTLMPYLFDVILYVRDVILYGLKSVTGIMLAGGAQLSLSNAFLLNAERTERFIDAIMYFGTVILTLYFAVIYISIAIDTLICFISFPILCVIQSQKRNLLDSWIMTVLSNLITPVLDAILLIIPLLTSMMLADVIEGVAIIQLIMCTLIIPARNRIKILLGVQSNERGGFFSAIAILSLGKAIAGKARGAFHRASDIRSDVEKSLAYKEMAKQDEREEDALFDGFRQKGESSKTNGLEDLQNVEGHNSLKDSEMDSSDIDTYDMETKENTSDEFDFEPLGNDQVGDMPDIVENQETIQNEEGEDGILPDEMEQKEITTGTGDKGVSFENKGDDREEGIEESDLGKNDRSIATMAEEAKTRNEILRNLENSMEEKQKAIDTMRTQKAGYQMEQKQLERQMLNYERGSDERRDLEKKRADLALKTAETEHRIAEQQNNMNQLKNQAKVLRGVQSGTPTKFDDARTAIMCKRANINNFEQPEFKNVLTNAQMSKLYGRRAGKKVAQGVFSGIGATAGTIIGGGSMVFMNPGASIMATTAGMNVGSAVGSGGVSAALAVGSVARGGVGTVKTMQDVKMREIVLNTDLDAAYGQGESINSAGTPQVRIQSNELGNVPVINAVTEDVILKSDVGDVNAEVIKEQLQSDIEKDSEITLRKMFSSSGKIGNSAAIVALERANIETEKYLASLRDTENGQVTRELEREKRIEFQTKFITEEIMKKLSISSDYEKGTDRYHIAEEIIKNKVIKIVEEKNKDLF